MGNPPTFNWYDIRKSCPNPPSCYDFSLAVDFLARDDVHSKLGVGDRKWDLCDGGAQSHMIGDWMSNLAPAVADVLNAKVEVLAYYGDKDFVCNWRGG